MTNETNVTFFPKAEVGLLRLNGEVNQAAVLELRDAMQEAADYWQYDRLVLEINSGGGESLALEALMHEATKWRQRGCRLETLGLMHVASAAALALSMGDMGCRKVHVYTKLLYHHSRYMTSGEMSITAQQAHAAQKRLQRTDKEALTMLLQHLSESHNGMQNLSRSGLERCQWIQQNAHKISNELSGATGVCHSQLQRGKAAAPALLKQIERAYTKAADQQCLDPLIQLLGGIFDCDERMPLDVAWSLMLIDEVEGAPHLRVGPLQSPSLPSTKMHQ